MRWLTPLVLALVLVLAPACSTFTSTSKTLEVTGESLATLGTQFNVVSRHMTDGCIAKTYAQTTCANYRKLGEKFKSAYPAARTLWVTATQYEDKALATSAQSAVAKLTADLAPFLALVGGK